MTRVFVLQCMMGMNRYLRSHLFSVFQVEGELGGSATHKNCTSTPNAPIWPPYLSPLCACVWLIITPLSRLSEREHVRGTVRGRCYKISAGVVIRHIEYNGGSNTNIVWSFLDTLER